MVSSLSVTFILSINERNVLKNPPRNLESDSMLLCPAPSATHLVRGVDDFTLETSYFICLNGTILSASPWIIKIGQFTYRIST